MQEKVKGIPIIFVKVSHKLFFLLVPGNNFDINNEEEVQSANKNLAKVMNLAIYFNPNQNRSPDLHEPWCLVQIWTSHETFH